jgi:hypothetical protein
MEAPVPVPAHPKLYHIVHSDRLQSIVQSGEVLCDRLAIERNVAGTTIGMSSIKRRRLEELELRHNPGIKIGEYAAFYFCPRSIMLYLIHCANHPELAYTGGQPPILHLEFDLMEVYRWAVQQGRHWGFTLSNAGSRYFEDRGDLRYLSDLNWDAIGANRWSGAGISSDVKEGKQAEFLVESSVPWALVERIGVQNDNAAGVAYRVIEGAQHKPVVQRIPAWYY